VRVPVIVAGVVVVLAVGAGVFFFLVPAPAPAPVASREVAPAPRPVTPAPTPEPATPAPEPARRAAPKPAAAAPAAPPPAPVEAAPTTATLRIEADVPDATVLFDRVGVGTAPVTIPNVSPGSHRLNASATGYDGYAETIEVEPGSRTITVAFKDVKLDATLAAVHKHGMGSCRGQLIASPQGIRYEAADGKDNFSVAMADIDGFEVDYLAKNLRLKTKQGKTYNFTDPDGNADRLFVFHRDVDKARKRLASGK
jgi:hypothetical protein